MSFIVLQNLFFIAVLIALSIPLGLYIHRVMNGQKVFLSSVISPAERGMYKVCNVKQGEEMGPKKYALSVIAFSVAGFVFLFLLQLLQYRLPLNPQGLKGLSWHLAFNTAASFVSNTNWQAYAGESTMSYLTQAAGLTVQNFVSAATGIAVLFALIRGFIVKNGSTLGSFWVDLIRVTLYILIPLSFIVALLLVSQGVVQSILPYRTTTALQSGASQIIPLGPAASQIAIKQLGTNGGGFFGANSAFPLENPTPFSNFIEMLSLLIIPASLCVTFGKAVKDNKQGRSLFAAMLILFVASLAVITVS